MKRAFQKRGLDDRASQQRSPVRAIAFASHGHAPSSGIPGEGLPAVASFSIFRCASVSPSISPHCRPLYPFGATPVGQDARNFLAPDALLLMFPKKFIFRFAHDALR